MSVANDEEIQDLIRLALVRNTAPVTAKASLFELHDALLPNDEATVFGIEPIGCRVRRLESLSQLPMLTCASRQPIRGGDMHMCGLVYVVSLGLQPFPSAQPNFFARAVQLWEDWHRNHERSMSRLRCDQVSLLPDRESQSAISVCRPHQPHKNVDCRNREKVEARLSVHDRIWAKR